MPAFAASVFNVDRVFVHAPPSAIEAREIAARRQREALAIVLKRLTPEINWPQLPITSELAGKSGGGLSGLERKTTTNRYIAELSAVQSR